MNLNEWLKKNRYTKAEFARQLNTTQNSVRRWAKRGEIPNPFMRKAIKDFTEGEVDYDKIKKESLNN